MCGNALHELGQGVTTKSRSLSELFLFGRYEAAEGKEDATMAKFLTSREAARTLKVSLPVLRRAIRAGRVPVLRLGPRTLRFTLDGLKGVTLGNGKPAPRRRRRTATR